MRRIDEGHDRQRKFFRQLHQAQGLAVALRTRHAKVAVNLFLGITPLLVPDHHHRLAIEPRQTANDGMVVSIGPVTVQFLEVSENMLRVIQRIRTLRMARHLGDLPGGQLGVDFLGQLRAFLLQAPDFFRNIDRGIILYKA